MLSSILTSKHAIKINIHIMRAFVKLAKASLEDSEIRQRLKAIDQRSRKSEAQVTVAFLLIKELQAEQDGIRKKMPRWLDPGHGGWTFIKGPNGSGDS